MSLLTYILLVGLQSGKMKTFHPDVLGITASFALFAYIVQFMILSLFLYLVNVSSYVAWMDLISLIGYMFVAGVLNTFFNLFDFGVMISIAIRVYICIAMSFFTVLCIHLVTSIKTYHVYYARSTSNATWKKKKIIFYECLCFINWLMDILLILVN